MTGVAQASARRPPVIVLGGGANAVSVARGLGRRGVRVYAINHPREAVRYSRYCRYIALDGADAPKGWERFLLGPESDSLRGAILLACSDEAIEIIIANAQALAKRFILEECDIELRACLLNKLCTYRLSRDAGIPTPGFWTVQSLAELEASIDRYPFPLLVKPLLSHKFQHVYGQKYFLARDRTELRAAFLDVSQHGIDVMLVEFIAGEDDRSRSYNAYLDEDGQPITSLTKGSVRRYPRNMGGATYHFIDRNPEVEELGLRLFRHIGLRGIGHVEFKRDDRDGKLKIIEVNARFVAPNCLLVAAGVDLAAVSYDRLTGGRATASTGYRTGLRLWLPKNDFLAFRELQRLGRMTFMQWVASLLHRQRLAYFSWRDPLPCIIPGARWLGGLLGKATQRGIAAARAGAKRPGTAA